MEVVGVVGRGKSVQVDSEVERDRSVLVYVWVQKRREGSRQQIGHQKENS